MPDWVVLISMPGGMELFGITGIVIGLLIAALFMASWGIFTRAAGVVSRGYRGGNPCRVVVGP